MKARLVTPCCLLLFLTAASAGCVQRLYPGPALPRDQVAVVAPNPAASDISVQVVALDDEPVNLQTGLYGLMPGSHTFELILSPITLAEADPETLAPGALSSPGVMYPLKHQRSIHITLDLAAGQTYGFAGSYRADRFQFWVYNTATDEVIYEHAF